MTTIAKAMEVFSEALGKTTTQEREVYLDEACEDDPSLRSEVEALLRVRAKSERFLPGPILGRGFSLQEVPISETSGAVIGQYTLLERVGEGGMAVVYAAQQERPIRRKIAIKIVKLGMDTRQVIRRFDQERQVLAILDHPSIAKVIDAGTTESGRPYFVMELVEGVSISQYCQQEKLSVDARLELILKVCEAIQHAHNKGVIHRDIKPSNILVSVYDGKTLPKVIDFGIAKATSQKLTEKTVFTRYAQVIGTPAYMSPEQAQLSEIEIDTRTDVYSMGVLLYELLTGTTPHDLENVATSDYVQIQRLIIEQEPPKPSSRLESLGASLPETAEERSTDPTSLVKVVRGDLDWIVMKALEKDRTRRYETIAQFASDIHRHMKNEPVLAAAPTMSYRIYKFVRRNRWAVGAVLAIAVVLIAGITTSSMGFMQATRQRNLAWSNLRKAQSAFRAISQVARLRITGASVVEEAQIQLALIRNVQSFCTQYLEDYPDDQEMTKELAGCHETMGQIHMRLGNYKQAEQDYRKTIRVLSRLNEVSTNPRYLRQALAIGYSGLAYALLGQGRDAEAQAAQSQCVQVWPQPLSDKRFGILANMGSEYNTPYLDGTPKYTADGLEAFFGSNRDGGHGHIDIWSTNRESSADDWSQPINLGAIINSELYEGTPAISPNGLELIFPSERAGGMGSADLWVTRRKTRSEPWGEPTNLGEQVNTPVWEGAPFLSSDGLTLFFESSRSGGQGYDDLWFTTRSSLEAPWEQPSNLGRQVNSAYNEASPCISPDGLTLFFGSTRPGGFGDSDMWMVERADLDSPWEAPENLGPAVNTVFLESHPSISPDGTILYVGTSGRPDSEGRFDRGPGRDGLGNWDACSIPILSAN